MKSTWCQYFGVAGVFIASVLLFPKAASSDEALGDSSAHIQLKKEADKIGSGLENPLIIRNLRVEVARMGDQSERKRIREALRDKDPAHQYEAIIMAKAVRGSDMICGLAELLNDTNGYRSLDLVGAEPSNRQDDVVFAPPSIEAAKALSELIDTPPVPPPGKGKNVYSEEDVALWKTWWEENRMHYEAQVGP